MNRRHAMASLAVMAANTKLLKDASAQVTVTNDNQIVSTGDVTVTQDGEAIQTINRFPNTETRTGACFPGEVRFSFEEQSLIVCDGNCEWHILNLGCRKGRCGR